MAMSNIYTGLPASVLFRMFDFLWVVFFVTVAILLPSLRLDVLKTVVTRGLNKKTATGLIKEFVFL